MSGSLETRAFQKHWRRGQSLKRLFLNYLNRLSARENFIEYCRRENFIICNTLYKCQVRNPMATPVLAGLAHIIWKCDYRRPKM